MRHPQRALWAPIFCVLFSCGGSNSLSPGVGQAAGAGAGGTSAAGAGGMSAAGAPGAAGHAGGLPECAKSAGGDILRPPVVSCTGGAFGTTTMACTSDSDCAVDGGAPGNLARCINHLCAVAACFVNEDCPGHDVCVCASGVRLYNRCAPADCRTDADCGAGGICASTNIPSCGAGPMYTCLSAGDACCSYLDCTDAGAIGCQFIPEAGHFQCITAPTCIGGG